MKLRQQVLVCVAVVAAAVMPWLAAHDRDEARSIYPWIGILLGALIISPAIWSGEARILFRKVRSAFPWWFLCVLAALMSWAVWFAFAANLPPEWAVLALAGNIGYFFFCVSLASKADGIRRVCWAFIVTGLALLVESVYHLAVTTPDYSWLLSPARFWHDPGSMHVELRMGLYGLPWASRLAAIFNLCLSATLGLAANNESRWRRVGYGVLACIWPLGVLLTGTRAALVVTAALFMVALAYKPGLRRQTAGMLTLTGVGAIAVMFMMRRSPIRGDGSGRTRLEIWRLCIELFKDNPLFGQGPNAFRRAWPLYGPLHGYGYTRFMDPHSIYFHVLSDCGLVGVALVATGGLHVIALWIRAVRTAAQELRPILFLSGCGIAAICFSDLMDVALLLPSIQLFVIAFVGCVVANLPPRARRSAN